MITINRDDGSAGLLLIWGCLVVISMGVAFAGLALVGAIHARVDGAADLAALAVTDSLLRDENPCAVGARIAELNGAVLEQCHVAGLSARVTVSYEIPASIGRFTAWNSITATAAARVPTERVLQISPPESGEQ